MVKRKAGGKVEKKQGFKDRLDETKSKKKRDEMKAGHKVNEMLDRRASHAKDERKERKTGGRVETTSGEAAKRRLDRPGRKRGGGVGSDASPLTSAARITDRREGGGEDAMTGGN
ncbi:MAG: hypothetical protein B7Z68_00730 [Acidobacteria bacterium 21-70-11]|nr:MAG: hypothetical protein B7Z68_00730 [Acidobacteria bacterium 21-70-11]